jgi:hypothetical protein
MANKNEKHGSRKRGRFINMPNPPKAELCLKKQKPVHTGIITIVDAYGLRIYDADAGRYRLLCKVGCMPANKL